MLCPKGIPTLGQRTQDSGLSPGQSMVTRVLCFPCQLPESYRIFVTPPLIFFTQKFSFEIPWFTCCPKSTSRPPTLPLELWSLSFTRTDFILAACPCWLRSSPGKFWNSGSWGLFNPAPGLPRSGTFTGQGSRHPCTGGCLDDTNSQVPYPNSRSRSPVPMFDPAPSAGLEDITSWASVPQGPSHLSPSPSWHTPPALLQAEPPGNLGLLWALLSSPASLPSHHSLWSVGPLLWTSVSLSVQWRSKDWDRSS